MTKQEAIEQFKDYENSGWSKSITPSSEALCMAIEALEQQAKIVHCVECKYLKKEYDFCEQYNIKAFVRSTDYCSWGEKRGGKIK